MQELALQAEAPRAAVGAVAGERMADRGEVGPDLVRAAGLQPRADQRVAVEEALDLEVRAGLARRRPRTDMRVRSRASRPSGASIVPVRDSEPPAGQRQVLAHDLAPRGSAAAARRGPPALGDEHQARRVAVEAVDGERLPAPPPAAAEQLHQRQSRGVPAPGGRPARRLVDDERSSSSHTIRGSAAGAARRAARRRSTSTRSPPRRRCPWPRGSPSTSTAPVSISSAAAARDSPRALGQPGVEPLARGLAAAPPAHPAGIVSARRGSGRGEHQQPSNATPATIATSARLNAGHSGRIDEVDRGADPDAVDQVPERPADHQPHRQPQSRPVRVQREVDEQQRHRRERQDQRRGRSPPPSRPNATPLLRTLAMSIPKIRSTGCPRSIVATTSCLVTWSSAVTITAVRRAAAGPRRRRAPACCRHGRTTARSRRRRSRRTMQQHDDGDDRAQVEREAAAADRRKDAAEQVQVGVGHLVDEARRPR